MEEEHLVPLQGWQKRCPHLGQDVAVEEAGILQGYRHLEDTKV